jgi:hypothetical protein
MPEFMLVLSQKSTPCCCPFDKDCLYLNILCHLVVSLHEAITICCHSCVLFPVLSLDTFRKYEPRQIFCAGQISTEKTMTPPLTEKR